MRNSTCQLTQGQIGWRSNYWCILEIQTGQNRTCCITCTALHVMHFLSCNHGLPCSRSQALMEVLTSLRRAGRVHSALPISIPWYRARQIRVQNDAWVFPLICMWCAKCKVAMWSQRFVYDVGGNRNEGILLYMLIAMFYISHIPE